jgi:hypothetical protein
LFYFDVIQIFWCQAAKVQWVLAALEEAQSDWRENGEDTRTPVFFF